MPKLVPTINAGEPKILESRDMNIRALLNRLGVLLLLIFISGCNSNVGSGPNSQAEKLLILTDIHFNPYSGCNIKKVEVPCYSLKELIENNIDNWPAFFSGESVEGFKQETNNEFLIEGLDNLSRIIKKDNINTILVTGDLLEHDFGISYKKLAPSEYDDQQDLTNFTYKTTIYVLETIHKKFPDSKIYLALGNNDSDNGDYKLPSNDFLESMAVYLSDSIKYNKKEFISSYSQGGYFSTTLTKNITLIGINTNILSTINPNPLLAKKQLIWLQQKLAEAAKLKRKIILFQHIPYGADLYKSSISGSFVPVMDLNLQDAYLNTLNQYSNIIKTIYTGHYHAELLSTIGTKIPVIGTIAFNALFGNNPGFKIIDIDQDGNLNGYITYYSNLANGKIMWNQLYSFQQIYGEPKQIIDILNNFPFTYTESNVINYRKYFNGNNPKYPQPINSDKNWKYYYCGIKYVESEKYINCIKSLSTPKKAL